MRETRSVLFLTYHFPPEVGGIQTRLDHYLYWMREKGVKATVFFAVSRPRNLGTYTLHGAEVVVSLGKTQHLLQNAKKLRSLMVSQRADAIHVFTGVSTILSVYGLLLARAMRVPSVISMFGKEELEFLTLPEDPIQPLCTSRDDHCCEFIIYADSDSNSVPGKNAGHPRGCRGPSRSAPPR